MYVILFVFCALWTSIIFFLTTLGGPERRDSRENDGKRKTVIISVSLSLAATVIVVALISYLFHTGIIPIRLVV